MIRYIEHFTVSKRADGTGNEDRLVMMPELCAVIDGATRKSETAGLTGGDIAQAIAAYLAADPDFATLPALVEQLTAHLDALRAQDTRPDQRPSATLLLYSARLQQIIRVGDSHLRIGDETYLGQKAVDIVLSEMRSLYLRLSGAVPGETDPGRALILPVLKLQHHLQNNADFADYGYGCLDGTAVPESFFEIWDVPAGTEVVICSDGYPAPARDLASAEADLARLLEQDPSCIDLHKSTKGLAPGLISFDDRSYLRFVT